MQGEAERPGSVGLRGGRATSSLSSIRVSGRDWGTKPCWPPDLPEGRNPSVTGEKAWSFPPCPHHPSDYAETRVSETLELAATQHKLQLLPPFSLAPHFNLLSGCEKAVGSHSRVHGRNPPLGIALARARAGFPAVGTGTAPLVLAELRWFASPEDPPPGAGCCLHLPGECSSFWQQSAHASEQPFLCRAWCRLQSSGEIMSYIRP